MTDWPKIILGKKYRDRQEPTEGSMVLKQVTSSSTVAVTT
jgi:hypothetical protein